MDKVEELQKLKKEMEEDKSLPLREGATQLVFGEGNPDAEIYCAGEAPGYHEDQQGRPFVGQAGQLLNRTLGTIGLKREDVYISNVVRFRPPSNRDPQPTEIAAFQPYVDREIKIIDPKVIVTLGRFSMNKFLPGEMISRVHGRPRKVTWHGCGVTIVPMYHPAAALRSPQVMQEFQEDFKKLPQILDEAKKEEREEKREQMNLL
ncbi:MAG: uracil-DNA glycosylase [Candidatus Blackburnbacteria bacterium]|nr:uracil-DNA glycosylase [Candidatus Blackburnbacteria bacterium]